MKGLFHIAFFMIIAVVLVVAVYIFLAYFKLHIVVLAADIVNTQNYQNIPPVIMSLHQTGFSGYPVEFVHTANKVFNGLRLFDSDNDVIGDSIVRLLPESCYSFGLGDNYVFSSTAAQSRLARAPSTAIASTDGCDGGSKLNLKSPYPSITNGVPVVNTMEMIIYPIRTTNDFEKAWPRFSLQPPLISGGSQ